jgi:probable HAF family extracellular repeat protein
MRFLSCLFVALLLGAGHLSADILYSVTDLGTFLPSGINNAGQMTGSSDDTSTGNTRAFLHSNGQMTDLGTLGGSCS